MSYLGRAQLGQTICPYLQCVDASGSPVLPDDPPQIKIRASTGNIIIVAAEMPLVERFVQTGLFKYPLYLGSQYTTGLYEVNYYYRSGAHYGLESDNFEIVPAGHADGQVLNMHFYNRPHAQFIVYGTETGAIVRGRKPTVR